MANHTISTDVLYSASAEEYFTKADSRIVMGLRATLELLGLPLPSYAERRPPGRPPSRGIMSAYRGDTPQAPNHTLRERRPNAPAETVAAAKAARAQRLNARP